MLLLLFAASGCSALIYEIVWYQLLQLAIGSTAVSLGVLLAAFMGGLCIGSIGLPRLRLRQHPLRIYAYLELGIGLCGILALFAIPQLVKLYIAAVGLGLPGMLLRGLIAAICLLPPTILMGASLPAIVRWGEATRQGPAWWGLLYGGNTVGAVFGCLLAGFYLLRLYDTAVTTYVAAAINLAVALASFALAARTPVTTAPVGAQAAAVTEPASSAEPAPSPELAGSPAASADHAPRWTIYTAIALSGASALGAEVVWTRLMSIMLLATVYVLSIILAVFLIGIAIGSAAGSWILKRVRPRLALGWCQALLVAGIAWTAYMIADSLPYWSVNVMVTTTPWNMFAIDLGRCLIAILPPAILWGASFPFAFAAATPASGETEPGRLVGGVYAANTLGAIVGALAVSLVLIPWIGTQQSQRLLIGLSILSALIVLLPVAKRSAKIAGALAASVAVAGLLAWRLDPVPGELISYGRFMAAWQGQSKVLYTKEGRNSSISISQWNDGTIYVNVNGHVEATTEPYDMKLQRMVGHLPALLHPNPKSILGIGFGAGVSAGTFTRYPGIQKITICEIEPVIPPTTTRFFGAYNYRVKLDPRTHIVYDDARHYVLTTKEKFDIIASDPLDVFVKGTASLYSKEYFEAVKQHLNPGGFFTLYVPLYETDEKTFKSELATFFDAFPNATIWANTRDGQGYDMVFMGQVGPLTINVDEIQKRLERPDYAKVAASLRDIGVNSAIDLFSTYAGQKSDLGRWVAGADINHDKDLRLQYLAGWGINAQLEDYLYRQMMTYRQIPQDLFTGSPDQVRQLQYALIAAAGTNGQLP